MSDKRKYPPNMRDVTNCRNCNHSMLMYSEYIVHCEKYDCNIRANSVCDSHTRENKDAKD
jgi:hypothetical protein